MVKQKQQNVCEFIPELESNVSPFHTDIMTGVCLSGTKRNGTAAKAVFAFVPFCFYSVSSAVPPDGAR